MNHIFKMGTSQNGRKNYFHNIFSPILFLFISVLFYCCKPSIRSFTVKPLTITSLDSVKATWDVSGAPTLLIHENTIVPDSTRGIVVAKYLELTLVARKGGKETKRMIQVTMLPSESSNEIVFSNVLSTNGDTLIAKGEKNKLRWGDEFQIVSVASHSKRQLYVRHSGKSAELSSDGTPSNALEGTPIEGPWEIRSLVTAAEKKDLKTAPETLSINTTIQYKKR